MNIFTLILTLCYALANKLLEKYGFENFLNKRKKLKMISKYLTLMVLISIFLSIFLILLVPFIVFKFLLSIYLRIKHGENFGGFLNTTSSSFAQLKEQFLIKSILFIEYDDRLEEFYEDLKICMQKTVEDFYHLQSTIELKYGYYYFVKNRVNFEDIFSKITLNKDKETLELEAVLDYLDEMRSYDHKKLFEIIFLNQPVWLNNKKTYAILFKANHCLLDGVRLLSVIFKHLCKNKEIKTLSIDTSKFVKSFKLDDCYFYKKTFGFEANQFVKYDKQYSAYFIEDQPEFKNKIKFISKKLGVKYTQVITAGFSYAVSYLMDKKNVKPCNIPLAITIFSDLKHIQDMAEGKSECDTLTNSFLAYYIMLPKYKKQTLREFLFETVNECEKVVNSANLFVTVIVCKILSLFPISLWKEMFTTRNDNVAFMFSNMFEHSEKVALGRTVSGFYTALSNVVNKSMFFATGCYDNRFIMNIGARQDFIRSRGDLQFILDQTLKYIDTIYHEIIEEKLEE